MNLMLSAKNCNRLSKLLSPDAVKYLIKQDVEPTLRSNLSMAKRHHGGVDHIRMKIGKREIVGYGINGSPVYLDLLEFPMPAIRFKEPTEEIEALREREKSDWHNLSLDEKKKLYRYSFCQTFAEMVAPTGYWKVCIGCALWAVAIGIGTTLAFNCIRGPLPSSYSEDARQMQLKRIIGLRMNPVNGIASKWDYEIGDWKQ